MNSETHAPTVPPGWGTVGGPNVVGSLIEGDPCGPLFAVKNLVRNLLVIVAGCGLLLVACGGDDDTAAPASAPASVDDGSTDDALDDDPGDDPGDDDAGDEDIDDDGELDADEPEGGDVASEPAGDLDLDLAGADWERPAEFSVVDGYLVVIGEIDTPTPDAFADVIAQNPQVTTLVLALVPGSADDDANLELAQMVRDRGLATVVPANGLVASGGTDLFLAGVEREVEPGACLGVHSWAAGDDLEGADLPDDDPEHDVYLDYYDGIGIDEDFYWFTLDAAPAQGMYWMNADDVDTYEVVTEGSGRPGEADDCVSRLE